MPHRYPTRGVSTIPVLSVLSFGLLTYIVSDVDAVIPFYTDMLGFKLDMHPAPGFASLSRGDLQLLLNRPGAGGAARLCPSAAAGRAEMTKPLHTVSLRSKETEI